MLTRPLYETYPDLYPREVQRLMVCANMLNSANAINKAWSAFTSKYGNGSRAEYHVNRQQLWHGARCRQLIAMRAIACQSHLTAILDHLALLGLLVFTCTCYFMFSNFRKLLQETREST
jgi:hypothetical protein